MTLHIKNLKLDNEKISIVRIINESVDREQNEVENRAKQHGIPLTKRQLNDPHFIALVICSWCQLVCTEDSGARRYIKTKALYPSRYPKDRPKIYNKRSHRDLVRIAKATVINPRYVKP